ncbi:MAG: RecX family transcriptional regulator [Bdellovibrionales bacterium]|nr:RecX family transcriptional regulator [Bdellovibrionales bacterium]
MNSYRQRKSNFRPKSTVYERRLPTTTKDFYDLAMNYCSRRETSRAKMYAYLFRKAKGPARVMDEERRLVVEPAIQDALNQLERQKVIDDERYAGILVRDYQRRAKGQRYIALKLKEKGLESQKDSNKPDADEELERALQVVEKSLLKTRFKKIESPFELRQKLTQKLLASGFDLTLSKKAVSLKLG